MTKLHACLGQDIDLNIWTNVQAHEMLVGKPFRFQDVEHGVIMRAWIDNGYIYVEAE